MRDISVHNIGFYKPTPNTITHLAINKDKLALARIDATIEIWNIKDIPYIEKTIIASIENQTMQGLSWMKNRLFSTGMSGFLMEFDLHRLCVKTRTSLTGQAGFCMDANSETSKLAVGTELGYINIFDATDDDILFNKLTPKHDTKILCLKYDKSGKYIASGTEDYVIIWNAEKAQTIHKLRVKRQFLNKSIYVWCVTITSDLTVITGDSSGTLSFWDGKMGSLLYNYHAHKSDVLTICTDSKEETVYSSGMDNKIVSFANVQVKKNMQWVRSKEETYHTNVVMALRVIKNKIYSGGITGYLYCQTIDESSFDSYPPLLQERCAAVIKNGLVMLRHQRKIEIWKLGKISKKDETFLEESPKKLIIIQRQVRDHNKKDVPEGIITGALSNDGQWIAFSTQTVLRLLQFHSDKSESPSLVSVGIPNDCGISLHTLFTPNSKKLVLIQQNGDIQLLSLQDKAPTLLSAVETSSYHKDTITIVRISPNGKYLITANPKSVIIVWQLTNDIKYLFNLPKYSRPPLDIAFNSTSNVITVMYSDSKIIEYDLTGRKTISKFDGGTQLIKTGQLKNISYDPNNEKIIVFHDDSKIYSCERISKKDSPGKKTTAKIAKTDDENSTEQGGVLRLKNVVSREQHLVHMEWLSNDELVTVEVNRKAFIGPANDGNDKFGKK